MGECGGRREKVMGLKMGSPAPRVGAFALATAQPTAANSSFITRALQ